MAHILESRTSRLRLSISRKPVHYLRLSHGVSLGYRRNQKAGAWIMRVADGAGGNSIKAIGLADDFMPADGRDVLDFWQAQDLARKLHKPGQAAVITITEALDQYERDLENRGKDLMNVMRVRKHLPVALGRKAVTAVDADELAKWRDGLLKTLAPAGINRVTVVVKAALNLAADRDARITSRHAWQVGLKMFSNGHNARNIILDDGTVRQLIAAAHEMNRQFGLMVETAAVTGARTSQLARVTVGDVRLDPPSLLVPSSNKGRGQKPTTHVSVPITSALLGKYDLTRPAAAPLLLRKNGKPWRRADHSDPFKQLAKRCGLDPKEVTLYALRHSSIVRQLLAGVPIRVVAVGHDTSVAMIEATYSRHISGHADALIRAALL
jgi:integrase